MSGHSLALVQSFCQPCNNLAAVLAGLGQASGCRTGCIQACRADLLRCLVGPADSLAMPDLEVVTRVAGPEPGYVATPIIIVQCALTLLDERDAAPAKGGVFTVGRLLGNTSIIERLHEAGVCFDVLSRKAKQ